MFISPPVSVSEYTNSVDTMMDLLRGAFPANIVSATFGKDTTEFTNVTREDGTSYIQRNLRVSYYLITQGCSSFNLPSLVIRYI